MIRSQPDWTVSWVVSRLPGGGNTGRRRFSIGAVDCIEKRVICQIMVDL